MGVYRQERAAGTFDAGIQLALETLLSSPAFVFRIEHDPENAEPGTVYRISDIELASRLSFFLWRSLPDDELFEVAARGDLADPDVLDRQVRRMLADSKATRWMNDFVGQWLIVRNLELQEPDPSIFPEFEDNLRRAMIAETRMFFESQVRDDHSVLDLLRADYTFLNARLARHYNVPDVYGSHFRRVPVTNPARQGLLGHASILTVTSYAHRTSVVLRGKWVLENLLGAPPPPPPPNVPPLEENERERPKSLRERMEQHRSNPVCASCHAPLDPIGFVLENFDAVGQWRDADGGVEIDAATTLADGTEIANLESYRRFLLDTRRQDVLRTVVEKLLAFGLGRGLEYYDAPIVRKIVRDAPPRTTGGRRSSWGSWRARRFRCAESATRTADNGIDGCRASIARQQDEREKEPKMFITKKPPPPSDGLAWVWCHPGPPLAREHGACLVRAQPDRGGARETTRCLLRA